MTDERRARVRSQPIVPGTVLYESFGGNGALDNPEAIFRALIDDPEFAELRHIWAVEPSESRTFRAEFSGHPRVSFVRPRSVAYAVALSRSEYLINNATFGPEFQKRDGQFYLNTWHGTPLKTMGYDMPAGAFDSSNVLRNFVSADLLLSQNPHMTGMYTDAYRLAGILPGQILEGGYPRTDRQHLGPAERRAALDALHTAGFDTEGRRLVLYAPTWRGTDFGTPRDEAEDLVHAVDVLQALLGREFLVLLKVHQSVARGVEARAAAGRLVPNEMPTNVLLGITDVLVTDYSSIFIDFLSTARPIVFYTPDRASYSEERGTYFDPEDLPGVVATTVAALATAILNPPDEEAETTHRARRWRRDFTPRDDGRATARTIDAVFRRHIDPLLLTRQRRRRPSVLLYLGGMRSNGITSSALNLLAHLDHDAVEISVLMARPGGRDQRANSARINPRVRQFHRRGGLTGRRATIFAMRVLGRLRPGHAEEAWERRLWEDEWRRCLGDARFDAVIDFSGYSRFWSEILLHSPPARRLIWLHNDMTSEVHRLVDGRPRMRRSLPAVFALYPRFDGLVSVSEELSRVNADSLAARYGIERERFLSARNVIDDVSAHRMLATPLPEAVEFHDPETGKATVPDWARRLNAKGPSRWFVTVGRLSPEKNHARLIEAFAQVHAEHPGTRLLIVGDGPLRAALERQRTARGLDEAVIFTGALANPFAVLALSDCFVLSSDYEGQPMVILEAAVAGLPIVTVRFGSVVDALPDGRLHVVDQSAAGLAGGMRAYLTGNVLPAALAAEEYNGRALREFLGALGSGSSSSPFASSSEFEISASTPAPTLTATTIPTSTTAPTATNHHTRASSSGNQPRRERL
ncbi:MAG TPA: glycosyltransferase [Pseudolysinimonas sp.]|jgi:CDP-glycerol glycerophosphotransferase (TagB/SpsB family)